MRPTRNDFKIGKVYINRWNNNLFLVLDFTNEYFVFISIENSLDYAEIVWRVKGDWYEK